MKALKDPSLAEAMVIPATMDVLSTRTGGKTIIPEPSIKAPHRRHAKLSVASAARGVPRCDVGHLVQALASQICPSGRRGRDRLQLDSGEHDGALDDAHRKLHCRRRHGRLVTKPAGWWRPQKLTISVTELIWCAQAEALPMHSSQKRVNSSMRSSRQPSKGSPCQIRRDRISSLQTIRAWSWSSDLAGP